MLDGGADVIELGVPFSDPLADGTTIQRSTFAALEHGVTLAHVLETVRELRAGGVDAPILTMGYMNPIEQYGTERFARDAADAGLDGHIGVDLPPEEADPLLNALHAHGLDLVFLVAPTSTEERIKAIAERASGFIYCVSVTGTTGARSSLSAELPEFIARVRAHTDLPLVVGFGISRPEHIAQIGQLCEAAAIGTAIIDVVERAAPDQRVEQLRAYVEVVTGRQRV
jgi:tryptophan synthase alpha chain